MASCWADNSVARTPGLLHNGARWSVVMNIIILNIILCRGGTYRMHYTRVSKQAGAFRVHSIFRRLVVVFSTCSLRLVYVVWQGKGVMTTYWLEKGSPTIKRVESDCGNNTKIVSQIY